MRKQEEEKRKHEAEAEEQLRSVRKPERFACSMILSMSYTPSFSILQYMDSCFRPLFWEAEAEIAKERQRCGRIS